ncbi:hypothetical protein EDD86DRAFT_277449 [Gorgonomyces haynaldii]|nr:hypothetical protein EDD86DRAFT_277449 [Gorgonomyces haynaldii]
MLGEKLLRFFAYTTFIPYTGEIQKLFVGITPEWTAKRIYLWQVIYVISQFCLQIPTHTIFYLDLPANSPGGLVKTYLNVVWGVMNGILGPAMSIRTAYVVWKFTFRGTFAEMTKLQVVAQFRKCLYYLVPVIVMSMAAIFTWVLSIVIKTGESDYVLSQTAQCVLILSFCLYMRMFICCRDLVHLGLTIEKSSEQSYIEKQTSMLERRQDRSFVK